MPTPFKNMDDNASGGMMEDAFGAFKMTRKQRLIGFGLCFVVGAVVSGLSFICLTMGNIPGWAIMYTAGNITSLMSTSFWTGFSAQFKKMFDPTRRIASSIFLGSMVTTLIIALKTRVVLWCLICCAIQFLALFWYSASYIPFAREMIIKVLKKVLSVIGLR
ncbi:hypothetical protein AMAG_04270 [Allomyces macrogynus ATCC 38327]|uniref:Protein transport protein SFT2 n=1 Tax=Allomyces macrogynus (strain ATCC 38327) TaxID=578462 RepID=A0A0L0S8L0_ALLM3|nr:hypothetical protein AMAG_04270 [Allomyces macrogynus ATCC 38327]|eukprot:KNE58719.1 hypothetical protein AMAG_04270 [Allomyces macrogynus ATCC 38327]